MAQMDTIAPTRLDQFLTAIDKAAADGSLVRLSLRMPFGADDTLVSVDIKPAMIREAMKLSFTFHHKTKDLVQNHPPAGAIAQLRRLLDQDFRQGFLFTTGFDLQYDAQGKTPRLKQTAPTSKAAAALTHDRQKARPIPAAGRPWLTELGITDAEGEVLKTAGDKYRQINRYVEILTPLLKSIPADRLHRILDMGAGKGYLTFAVADYLASTLGSEAKVTGVELRPDLVTLCNDIAGKAGLANLDFASGSIADYDAKDADVLIALHACDTATDDAIAQGIAAEAELIVVAPCCHKQIRREMERAGGNHALQFVTRHGIFLERQAEMVTDAIRAMVLEHFGYETKVFQFVSDVHTPKNVLITARRTGRRDNSALERIRDAKTFFGIHRHYLETAAGLV